MGILGEKRNILLVRELAKATQKKQLADESEPRGNEQQGDASSEEIVDQSQPSQKNSSSG